MPVRRPVQRTTEGQLFSQEPEDDGHEVLPDLPDLPHDMHQDDGEFHSPLAPSAVPEMGSAEQSSRHLETPPQVEVAHQGQQTTPEKPKMATRKKREKQEPLRLPKDGDFKLKQVGIDEVRSCNAQGRPKRKQMRVLNHWKNERVVYERVPGSACPTVCSVIVAEPVAVNQEAIPLELHVGEDKAWSPAPTNMSDATFLTAHSEEEKISFWEEGPSRATKAPKRARKASKLRQVQVAAEVASEAAAVSFAENTPPRARSSSASAAGFIKVPIADGSTHACEIRVGLDNGNWMCCDIKIPPRSFNTPEELGEDRSLLIRVMQCQEDTFTAVVDNDIKTLATGDSMVIQGGQAYCLRNGSDQVAAQLKMVLINSRSG